MTFQVVALWGFVVVSAIILGFASLILWRIYTKEISLAGLLLEPDGNKASLSRFQFLIFTFVFAGVFLMLSIEAGTFVDIPTNVLALLGISSGSYVISKAVGKPPTPPDDADGGKPHSPTDNKGAAPKSTSRRRPERAELLPSSRAGD